MKEAIIATLDHYCLIDETPQHDNYSAGVDIWCEWRKAESMNQLKSFIILHNKKSFKKH
jgi:hypothetical protein